MRDDLLSRAYVHQTSLRKEAAIGFLFSIHSYFYTPYFYAYSELIIGDFYNIFWIKILYAVGPESLVTF